MSSSPALPGRALFLWLLVAAVATVSLGPAMRSAYPQRVDSWRLWRAHAEAIGAELLRDLGFDEAESALVTVLTTDPLLEQRLAEPLLVRPAGSSEAPHAGVAVPGVAQWWVLAPHAEAPGGWSYRARLDPSGRLLALERNEGESAQAAGRLLRAEALLESEQLLRGYEIDATRLAQPRLFRTRTASGEGMRVRFDVPVTSTPRLGRGVEVVFVGAESRGWRTVASWQPGGRQEARVRLMDGLTRIFAFAPLLALLPLGALAWRRRRSSPAAPVRSLRWRYPLVVALAGLAVAVATGGRLAASGATGGGRPEAVVAVLWLARYAPLALALWLLLRTRGRFDAGRRRLLAFDRLWTGRWDSPRVAAAALRGTALGLAAAASLLWVLALSRDFDAWPPFSYLLQRPAFSSDWPGVVIALQALIQALTIAAACGLALPRRTADRGTPTVVTAMALLLALWLPPPVLVLPLRWGFPVLFAYGLFSLLVVLRYDVLTLFCARLVADSLLGVLPLLEAANVHLEAQAWAALAVSVLPLVLSLRYLETGRRSSLRGG